MDLRNSPGLNESLRKFLEELEKLQKASPYTLHTYPEKSVTRELQANIEILLRECFPELTQSYLGGDTYLISEGPERRIIFVTSVISGGHQGYPLLISNVCLAKHKQGKGLSFEFLGTILEQTRQKFPGVKEIYLEVYPDNLPALKTYQKLGFQEIGRTKRNNKVLIVMKRGL